MGERESEPMSPVGLSTASPSLPHASLSQLLTCEGTGGLFRMASISLTSLTQVVKGRPCARGAWSASRSRKRGRAGRLLIFGLAGRILSCSGPSCCSEVLEAASCLLCAAATVSTTVVRGGIRKNLYLTWNRHSQTTDFLFVTFYYLRSVKLGKNLLESISSSCQGDEEID